ncbi:hypothetical protein Nepgr_014532 [Nepenthes gracilis]|uniref:Homeobox domain-containing protein n=1 Tax=Nepenthes gracilis TaxID=150966 RepID=A0AAD3XQE3_NEPGR|nr:hypothetical protein Nepgr_014532 [Nepenthes gracilis]
MSKSFLAKAGDLSPALSKEAIAKDHQLRQAEAVQLKSLHQTSRSDDSFDFAGTKARPSSHQQSYSSSSNVPASIDLKRTFNSLGFPCSLYPSPGYNIRENVRCLVSLIWILRSKNLMMATYFHGGSEIQSDNPQTLYLMNPNYSGYYSVSDTHQHQQQQQPQPQPPQPLNMLSVGTNALNPGLISHALLPSHHFLGIPLANPDDLGLVPRVHYNLWSSVDPAAGSQTHITTPIAASASDLMGFRRPVVTAQQRLSLSLSPQHNSVSGQQGSVTEMSPTGGGIGGRDEMGLSGSSPTSVSAASNGVFGVQSVILGSKYLKAAQQLLDEVASVGKAKTAESGEVGTNKEKTKEPTEPVAVEESSRGADSSSMRVAELTTAHRQELQMKKAKLLNMLDEVEQRYRQYHNQMRVVVVLFEKAAGPGSAKSYTTLALKTISKQFRCLKDSITAQINATSKSLGEDDGLGGKGEGSRLRFVDHQFRRQRALQQLGVMQQHSAWRPQRGLPERAVSVLRAWLFEHFLHPYPKDSDKHMLAKQAGLTRNQVSNWFINARVRLWKPMVEEMYLEETKAQELNGSEDNNSGKNDHLDNNNSNSNKKGSGISNSAAPRDTSIIRAEPPKTIKSQRQVMSSIQYPPVNDVPSILTGTSATQGFSLVESPSMEFVASPTKKQRSNDMQNSPISILSTDMEMKPSETRRDLGPKYGMDRNPMLTSAGQNHGYGAYQIDDMGMFNPEQLAQRYHGNGVSLTLGLQHCENLSHDQQNYISTQNIQLGTRLEMSAVEPNFCGISSDCQPSHSSAGYESIDMQKRKRLQLSCYQQIL